MDGEKHRLPGLAGFVIGNPARAVSDKADIVDRDQFHQRHAALRGFVDHLDFKVRRIPGGITGQRAKQKHQQQGER
jgi:hypothetical protein